MVGAERFELSTSCSQSRRSTRLSYTPKTRCTLGRTRPMSTPVLGEPARVLEGSRNRVTCGPQRRGAPLRDRLTQGMAGRQLYYAIVLPSCKSTCADPEPQIARSSPRCRLQLPLHWADDWLSPSLPHPAPATNTNPHETFAVWNRCIRPLDNELSSSSDLLLERFRGDER